jgi:peptidoglycan hydrolase-like protein with peptidoglycan-binding domain
MTRISARTLLVSTALALVAAACGGGEAVDTTQATIISAVDAESSSTTTTTQAAPITTSTTTTLPASGPAIASQGDDNETVEAIQFLLVCGGFGDLTVDGDFGPGTLTAVEAAQTALGRQVTGSIDEETFVELARLCPEPRPVEASTSGLFTIVGNAAPEDPDSFVITLPANTLLEIEITRGSEGVDQVSVSGTDGTLIVPTEGPAWEIAATGDYRIQVTSLLEPVTFSFDVTLTEFVPEAGQWILAGDGLTFGDQEFELGDDAQTVIDGVIEILGHEPRNRRPYNEFDTDWYEITDPQVLGLRGVFIEGLAFLFFGPSSAEPSRPETLERIRFEGPSEDADGEPRPENYITTAAGITVGDSLSELKAAYGDAVDDGSNDDEYYYRLSDSGGTLCFYFGADEPGDSDTITEIATECRG